MSAGRGAWTLVRDRTFGTYLAGNVISNTGNWFQNVAAGIVVYRLTGSSTLVGVTAVLQFGATLLLGPYAGSLADRFDRRRLLIGAQMLGTTAAAALAVLTAVRGVEGLGGPLPIWITTAVLGVSYAVTVPTLLSLVPALVEPDDLDTAIALNSSSFTVARAVGPALAGLAIAAFGAVVAFGVNAISFLGLAVALLIVNPSRPTRAEPAGAGADRSVRGGLQHAIASPDVRAILLCTLVAGVAADPVNTLSPAVAERLGGGEALVGYQVAAFGGGSAAGTFVVGRLRAAIGGRWRSVTLGLAVLGASQLGYAFAPTVPIALGSLFVGGTGYLFAVTSLNADLQTRSPEELRGRLMALWSTSFLGSRPVAALTAGAVADVAGTGVAVAGVALLPLAAAVWLVLRPRQDASLPDQDGGAGALPPERSEHP